MADKSKETETKDGGKKKYTAIRTAKVGSDSKGKAKIETVRGKETKPLTEKEAEVYRAHKLID